MSEFIIVGIIVILGVNGLYSRFCERPKDNDERPHFRRKS